MPFEPDHAILASLEDHLTDMLDDLRECVMLETPSLDRTLLAHGVAWVESWMSDHLRGGRARRTDGGQYGDTLEVTFDGNGGKVVVLGHYDTVWPAGTLSSWPFEIRDGVATGPGVFDMKAGLVQALWSLRVLRELDLPHPAVHFLFNGDEEIGSPASRPLIEAACDGADAVLVFEPSVSGAIKTARKGVGIYKVVTRGVEAHAGLDPTAGASAISEIASLIGRLNRMADPTKGTTVSTGTVHGGTLSNVVAREAVAFVDVRAAVDSEARRMDELLLNLKADDPRVTVHVEGGWNRPVMERTPQIAGIYARAEDIAETLGFSLGEAAVGGASDGNFAANLGLPVLDGVGAVGSGAHARNEHVIVASIPQRVALVANLLMTFAA